MNSHAYLLKGLLAFEMVMEFGIQHAARAFFLKVLLKFVALQWKSFETFRQNSVKNMYLVSRDWLKTKVSHCQRGPAQGFLRAPYSVFRSPVLNLKRLACLKACYSKQHDTNIKLGSASSGLQMKQVLLHRS